MTPEQRKAKSQRDVAKATAKRDTMIPEELQGTRGRTGKEEVLEGAELHN